MNRSKLAIKNSFFSLLCQVTTVAISFVTRSVFVKYLGVEMLGIGSIFTSVLSTLSLAELGFHSAIIYLLYQPLINNDTNRINDLISVLKRIYCAIGCFIIVGSLLILPFLKYILKGIEVTNYVRLVFLIQVASTSVTYFLAYRKTLLYVDQKSYATNLISTGINITFSIIKIILVVITKDYMCYVAATLVQNIVENTITYIYDKKIHSFVHSVPFKKSVFLEAWDKVKDVFIGKIAGYIYSSTDSLIISSFVGTVSVGLTVNYTTVTLALKALSQSILKPISPLIGNLLADKNDENKNEQILRAYTYIRFLIAGMTMIPMLILVQSFITVWVGSEYHLPNLVVFLYGMDLYIHLVHSALCDFVNGRGLFKQDKIIEIIGAATNFILSLGLVFPFGIEGVLIGTVISQSAFWIGRSIVVYRNCFSTVDKGLKKYWIQQVLYIILTFAITIVLSQAYDCIKISFFPLRFIVGAILCEVVFIALTLIIFRKSTEQKTVFQLLKIIFQKKPDRSSVANGFM